MSAEPFAPTLRERLNFYAKRLRPGAQSFLRISWSEAHELSELLADAEKRIADQDEMIKRYQQVGVSTNDPARL